MKKETSQKQEKEEEEKKMKKRMRTSICSCWYNDNQLRLHYHNILSLYCTWSDNKVHELATVCLVWQHWTKALVLFDDVDISAFHSCVVVDLWQSLSEWHLLLSACVLVCHRENVGT